MKKFVIVLTLLLSVNNVWSAGPPGGGPPGGGSSTNPNYCKQFPNAPGCATVPIDQHVYLLLILGIGLGCYMIYRNNSLKIVK